jgi:hypothetical protein
MLMNCAGEGASPLQHSSLLLLLLTVFCILVPPHLFLPAEARLADICSSFPYTLFFFIIFCLWCSVCAATTRYNGYSGKFGSFRARGPRVPATRRVPDYRRLFEVMSLSGPSTAPPPIAPLIKAEGTLKIALMFPGEGEQHCTANTLTVIYFITKTPWPESASELYRPSDRRLSAKLMLTFCG